MVRSAKKRTLLAAGIAVALIAAALVLRTTFSQSRTSAGQKVDGAPKRPRLLLMDDLGEACAMSIDDLEQSKFELMRLPTSCGNIEIGIDHTGMRAIINAGSKSLLELDLRSGRIASLPDAPTAVGALGFDPQDRPTFVAGDKTLFVLREETWTAWRSHPLTAGRNLQELLRASAGPFSVRFNFEWNEPWTPLTCGLIAASDSGSPALLYMATSGAGVLRACGVIAARIDPFDAVSRGGEFAGILKGPVYFETDVMETADIVKPVVQYKDGYLLFGEQYGAQRLTHLASKTDVFVHRGRTFIVGSTTAGEGSNAGRTPELCHMYWAPTVVVHVEPANVHATGTYSYGKGTEASHPCGHYPRDSSDTFNCGVAGGLYHLRITAPGRRSAFREIEVPSQDSCHGVTTTLHVTLDAE